MQGKLLAALTITGVLALLPLAGCKQKASENTAASQSGNGAMDYPILLGNDKIADKFGGILGLPTSMVYSRDGKKVKTVVGILTRDEISKTLENLLEGSPSSTGTASAPEGAVQLLVRGEVAALPLKGVIDFSAEKARLDKELAKAEADIKRVDAKLANDKFVANAPEEIVEEEKEKRDAAVARKAKILEALQRLKNAA